MDYDYIPLPQRQPLKWPNGARVALILTFNLETWDLTKDTDKPYYAGGPAILPDVLPGNTPDFPNFTWREYGQRVGLWRLIDLFDELGVKASCTTNAVTFERRKAMTDAVLERGWELLTHNWEQGELLTNFAHEPDKERDIILRSLAQFEKYTGRKSKGWLSSSLRGTMQTADILAEQGCTFYCDIMNDDQPYLLRTPHGPIVSVPYSNEIQRLYLRHAQKLYDRRISRRADRGTGCPLCGGREDGADHEPWPAPACVGPRPPHPGLARIHRTRQVAAGRVVGDAGRECAMVSPEP
ncbi:MAG: hypothetical protein U5M50_16175 [Sphingobium sp.]|nr:hypothetical protein [Sphingobium sp.]